jgi:hypothetical protein
MLLSSTIKKDLRRLQKIKTPLKGFEEDLNHLMKA